MKSVYLSPRPYGPRKGQLQDSWEIACEMMILLRYLFSKLWMAVSSQPSWLLSRSPVFSQPWCMSLGCYCTHWTVTTLDVSPSPSRWIVSLHVSRNQHNTRHMGRVYKISESSESAVDIPVTDSSQNSPVLRFWIHLAFHSCLAFPCHIPLCVTKCPLPVVAHFPILRALALKRAFQAMWLGFPLCILCILTGL